MTPPVTAMMITAPANSAAVVQGDVPPPAMASNAGFRWLGHMTQLWSLI
jgi:hypothetical protein